MKTPIYCRTSGQRVGACPCLRCHPVPSTPKPNQEKRQ